MILWNVGGYGLLYTSIICQYSQLLDSSSFASVLNWDTLISVSTRLLTSLLSKLTIVCTTVTKEEINAITNPKFPIGSFFSKTSVFGRISFRAAS